MVETLISPGVLARENDQSQLTTSPVTVGAAIIGPTVKGPVEVPTIVTSYSEYQNKFGTTFTSGNQAYTYFTSIAAYNYFNNGGTSLLVARVVSGSYTSATTNITNTISPTGGVSASAFYSASNTGFNGSPVFRITDGGSNNWFFIPTSSGTYTDDTAAPDRFLYFASASHQSQSFFNLTQKINSAAGLSSLFVASTGSKTADTTVLIFSASAAFNGYLFTTGSSFDTTIHTTQATLAGGVAGTGGTAFTLETLSKGALMNSSGSEVSGSLVSGSMDNLRWQVINPNTSSGTFDLLIRRGDDTSITNPIVLETWTGLSLDPFSPNYISRIIGDQTLNYNSSGTSYYLDITGSYPNASRYVRVSAVNNPTPYYLDNNGLPKTTFTSSIPIAASGSFSGALGSIKSGAKFYETIDSTDTQGLVGGNYTNMINLLSNEDDYKFNILLTPGLYNADYASQVTSIISNTQNRGDNIYILDLVKYNSTITAVNGQAASRNTSYAASYWPWIQTVDPDLGKNVWVPASTMIGGVYAYNDSVAEPWFAPAGINRGGLGTVIRAERKLAQSDRDSLYSNKVNPIATFPGQGIVVYGQKTLQTKASALDRVNVRRLLIALKSYITQISRNLVFEQNTIATRNQFLSQVNPYLESVQQRQGLYAFKVVMDDSNNTPDVVDRNQLVGAIYLQPTKTAEFIYLDFNITATGATFPA